MDSLLDPLEKPLLRRALRNRWQTLDLWHGFSNGWPAAASFFPAFVLRSKNQFMPDRRLVMPRYDMIALSEFDPFGSIQI